MLDFHTHILPSVDDGSKSVDESIEILSMLSEQSVKTVVASSHYYAEHESPEQFLERRNLAYNKLSPMLKPHHPKILLGAEVRYYEGISRMQALKSLCIEGTDLLLLEMPFARWSSSMLKEIRAIACSGEVRVVLAHIERYLAMQEKGIIDRLHEDGILVQTNASFFADFLTRRNAIRLLKKSSFDFIGSDCHGAERRPPRISQARDVIIKKLGEEFLSDFVGYSNNLL